MSLPPELRAVLPAQAAAAWLRLAAGLPRELSLVGGTGLAAHIHHRESRDLDFFFEEPVDLQALHSLLEGLGDFAPTLVAQHTLNGVLLGAKVQFLSSAGQRRLAPPVEIAGLRVASVEDLLAIKLKVIGDRGELRDYFDVMEIERRLGRTAEEGLALYRRRYDVPAEHETLRHIVLSLGYLDDVDDDHALPVERPEIERYWRQRQPQIVRHLSRFGV